MSTYSQGYIDSQLGVGISLGELGDIRSSSFTTINGKIIFAYIDNEFILRVGTNENTSYTEIYDSSPDLYSSVIMNQQGTALIAHRNISDIFNYTTTRLENSSQEINQLNTSYNDISNLLGERYDGNGSSPITDDNSEWSLFNMINIVNTSVATNNYNNMSTKLGNPSDSNTSTLWGIYNNVSSLLGNEYDTAGSSAYANYINSIYGSELDILYDPGIDIDIITTEYNSAKSTLINAIESTATKIAYRKSVRIQALGDAEDWERLKKRIYDDAVDDIMGDITEFIKKSEESNKKSNKKSKK